MIILLKKGVTYKAGEVLPLISIPVFSQGEKQEFNDFQWWAPTKDWNSWLKNNPREWQAESENINFPDDSQLYETFHSLGIIDKEVLSFAEFSSILEQDAQKVPLDGEDQASESEKKNFTKFLFAYNKLKESGKLSNQISISSLQVGKEYAIVTELPDENGNPVLTTRNANRSKVISDLDRGILVSMTESIPFGKFEEDDSSGNAFFKIAKLGSKLAATGITYFAVGAGAIYAGKKIWTRFAAKKATDQIVKGGSNWLTRFFTKGSETAVKGAAERTVANQAVNQAARQTVTELGGRYVATESGLLIPAEVAVGTETAAAGGAAAAGEAAAGLSGAAIGAIAAAVIVAAGVVQRLINWTSDSQAPRYSDLKGKLPVQDQFKPGSIGDGEVITICWTQSAGNSWFTDILWNEDTRTTMDVVKLGNFGGKAVFMLLQINSKAYNEILKKNDIVLLKFNEKETFDTSWYDNEDLEFELVAIPKGDQNLIVNTVFQGYCSWEEMENTYKNSDDSFLGVPENAPDEYSFHFKYGKSGREINVNGKLVRDIDNVVNMKDVFGKKSASNESEDFYHYHNTSLANNSEVFSFSEFSQISILEEENEEKKDDKPEYLTQTQKIAAYEVTSLEFADKAYEGQDLPDLSTFIVPDQFLTAKDQDEVIIQPVQDVTIRSAKRGTISIETEDAPTDQPVVGPTGDVEVEGGVPVEVTKGEIKIKFQDSPEFLNKLGIPDVTKIKDEDEKDKVTLLSVITPEEKEEIGIKDWNFIKKAKIYKDGKTGEPYLIKFIGESPDGKERVKIKASDAEFNTALKIAERIQAGFKQIEDEEKD